MTTGPFVGHQLFRTALAATVIFLTAWTSVAAGQVAGTSTSTARPTGDSVDVLVVGERPWTPAVTVTLVVAGGSGSDPEGSEGSAWLLGMVLDAMAKDRLSDLGSRVDVAVEPLWTVVTLLSTPDDWEAAYAGLEDVLFQADLRGEAVQAARRDLLAQLVFQRGAPVRSVELEVQRLLLGALHPGARPPTGDAETVGRVGLGALGAMKREWFRMAASSVAVVGPVQLEEVVAVVAARRTVASPPKGRPVGSGPDARPAGGGAIAAPGPVVSDGGATEPGASLSSNQEGRSGRPWTEGIRNTVSDDVTNTWIAAAYPLPRDSVRTDLEFLAHVLQRELAPDPPPPGLFHLTVELRDLPDGPAILVTAAVESRSAARWERRIEDTVAEIAATPMTPLFFNQHRRSFRSTAAILLAMPEIDGRRLLDDVRELGTPRDVPTDIALLSTDRLRRAASLVGPPRVLVFGPGGP